jgi:hypothetical protein
MKWKGTLEAGKTIKEISGAIVFFLLLQIWQALLITLKRSLTVLA